MGKLCTSVEQSRRLVELGLDVNTADMCYMYLGTEDKKYQDIPICAHAMEGDLCAWSLSSLFGLLPLLGTGEDTLNPFLAKTPTGEYYVVYATLTEEKVCSNTRTNAIDAVYEMVVWLLENGNLKKEE